MDLRRMMRCMWLITLMGDVRNEYRGGLENLKGTDHSDDVGVGGRIII
jgi:hypothetical protein